MIRIGIVGASPKISNILASLQEIDGIDTIGCYPGADHSVSGDQQVRIFESGEELIRQSDAVLLSSPQKHFEWASRILKASRHLYLDLPLAESIEQAKLLQNLAYEANVKFQVSHAERLNPAFMAALQYELKPMFIETHRLMNYGPENAGASIVLDYMIHDIDIVLSMVKSTVKRVSASGFCVVSNSPDIVNARLEFYNGCVVNLTASRISRRPMCKTRIFQHNAYIAVDFLNTRLEVLKPRQSDEKLSPEEFMRLVQDPGHSMETLKPQIRPGNVVKTELELFLQSIEGNTKPLVSVSEAYSAMDVAFQVVEKLIR